MLSPPRCNLKMTLSVFWGSSLLLSLTALPVIAATSKYRQLKLDPKFADKKTVSNLQRAKNDVISDKVSLNEGKAILDEFYTDYVLRAMTRTANLGKVAEMRLGILKDLAQTRSPDAHLYIVDKFFNKNTRALIQPKNNFHPAVRYNLTLLLGQLNQQEAQLRGSSKEPPIPHLKVLSYLIATYHDKDQIDAVRVAALLGIKRHIELRSQMTGPAALADEDSNKVTALALELAKTQQSPERRNASGHDWMRRRAIEILGHLGSPGQIQEIETTLTEIITNVENSIALRSVTTQTIGRINLEKSDEKAGELAVHAVSVAVAACESEIVRLDEMFDAGFEGGGFEGGGFGVASGMAPRAFGGKIGPESSGEMGDLGEFGRGNDRRRRKVEILDERTLPTRRKLIHQLQRVKLGLVGKSGDEGILRLASTGVQIPIQSMTGKIDAIVETLGEPETMLEELTDQLREKTLQLSSIVSGGLAAASEKSDNPEDLLDNIEEGSDLDELETDDTLEGLDF